MNMSIARLYGRNAARLALGENPAPTKLRRIRRTQFGRATTRVTQPVKPDKTRPS